MSILHERNTFFLRYTVSVHPSIRVLAREEHIVAQYVPPELPNTQVKSANTGETNGHVRDEPRERGQAHMVVEAFLRFELNRRSNGYFDNARFPLVHSPSSFPWSSLPPAPTTEPPLADFVVAVVNAAFLWPEHLTEYGSGSKCFEFLGCPNLFCFMCLFIKPVIFGTAALASKPDESFELS